MPVETTATATPTDAGTSPDAVLAVLPEPAMRTVVGRMLLVSDPASPVWRGGVLGWRARALGRAWRAAWQARWLAACRFDLGLALARWQGHPTGAATVVYDGIHLRYAAGRVELLIRCPKGHGRHAAPVADAAELASRFLDCAIDRTGLPWGCPPDCPGAQLGSGSGRLRAVAAPDTARTRS